MGNAVAKPTNKLKLLIESCQDMSFNYVSDVVQKASQNIIVSQTQEVTIADTILNKCKLNISQQAVVNSTLNAIFKSVLPNQGSILNTMNKMVKNVIDNQNQIISSFLTIVKSTLGVETDRDLKNKLSDIIKQSVENSVKQSCNTRVFVRQQQNVLLSGIKCNGNDITITQQSIVNAVTNCLFNNVINYLGNDKDFRKAIRQFNNDNSNLSDDELDKSMTIPSSFLQLFCPEKKCPEYAECEACRVCPVYIPPNDFFIIKNFNMIIFICFIIVIICFIYKNG